MFLSRLQITLKRILWTLNRTKRRDYKAVKKTTGTYIDEDPDGCFVGTLKQDRRHSILNSEQAKYKILDEVITVFDQLNLLGCVCDNCGLVCKVMN